MYKMVVAAAALSALISGSANAAVVLGGPVDLSTGPSFTIGPSPAGQFTFSYPSSGFFADTFVSTSGTAQVTAFGIPVLGIPFAPTVDFTDGRGGDVVYGPGYGTYLFFATATDIPFSATDSFMGLRYTIGADTYYGFAQFAGADLERYGFETTPNIAINASAAITAAVPEASTWAMMIVGFAGVGFMAYRRRTTAMVAV